jgi:RNA polymerase sigma-70 factor (ECF subfamily)
VHAVGQLGPTPEADPESSLIGDRLRARLTSELLALPEALRAPVILFDIEGLSYSEISEVLEVAEGTVKSRIHRARRALRARLRDLVAAAGAGS